MTTPSAFARVDDLELGTPLPGLDTRLVLKRSLESTPRDVIHDGLSLFGALRDDWKGKPRLHKGLDIYVDDPDVLAMGDGVVVGAGIGSRAGGWLKLRHSPLVEPVYVHVVDIRVEQNQHVQRGEVIARIQRAVGNAVEPQLHLEIKINGESVDPVPFFISAADPQTQQRWIESVESIPDRVMARQEEIKGHNRQPL